MDEDEEYVVCTELNIVIPANMPQLKNQGKGVFSATLAANTYAKFIPNQDGKYIVKRTYTDESDGYSFVENIYDSEFNQVYDSGDSVESVQLKKGSVYYLFPSDRKSKVTAEFVWSVKSVQLEGKFESAVFYTPVDFYIDSTTKKCSIEKTPWRTQKLKITYADGTTESVGLYKSDRYKQVANAYINYSGKKDAPEAGTYDVHFELGGKEAILKNGVQVKTLSQMPAITGKGTKEMAVTGSTVYGCLKTTSATSYTIKCEPQTMPYLTVYQLKNGKLERVLSVDNGKSCTLKQNSVYYIGMRLHSAVMDLDKVKFTVSSSSDEIKPSITFSNNSGILVAKLNTTDKIIEHGIVYGKGTNVTLNTPGRTRVAYSGFDSNKSYSFDTAKLTGCTIRAYVIYTDKNGNAQTVYSNAYSK